MFAKLLVAPVSIFLPHFSFPYGAGISIFAKESLAQSDDFDREPFEHCHGWLGSNGDCWARKGFQRVGIRTAEGAELDLYNTHLESGTSERSARIRREQLELLARAIEARPAARALIVAGDFNVEFNRDSDRETIVGFRRRLQLSDSGAGPELPYWRERDYILFRAGRETQIRVERAGEAREFVERDRALSDHPALFAEFRAERAARAGR